MRIKTEPKVYLVARPAIAEGFQQFLTDEGLSWPTEAIPTRENGSMIPAAQQLTELAGRCCYMSFGSKAGSKSNVSYIKNLVGLEREGPAHGSVLEHANFSFLVVGAGRGFSHEQVRHRAGWAYSQLSTRYCDFEREDSEGTWDPGFVIPPLGQLTDETEAMMTRAIERSREFYVEALGMIEADLEDSIFGKNLKDQVAAGTIDERQMKTMLRKAARGAARDVLPIATEAIMTMTGNARAIWNASYLRASEHAEGAIRSVYVQILRIMQAEMPYPFREIIFKRVWDGSDAAELPRDKL